MWNTPRAVLCLGLLETIALEAGCGAPQRRDGTTVQTLNWLLPVPNSREKVAMDTVVIGNVGKTIGRDDFKVPIEFKEPALLHCKVTYRQLAPDFASAAEVALNVSLDGPGTDSECSETPLLLSKEINCTVKRRGLAKLTIWSANPSVAVGFGFTCSQTVQRGDAVADGGALHQAHASGGRRSAAGVTPAAKPDLPQPPPDAGRLNKRLEAANDGQDDKHKILTLAPCDEPLKATSGSIKIGKSTSRRYIVHKSKTCEVEVADVPENMLEADTQVILTP